MITEKLQNAINAQITREIWSSNLYLSMAFYLDKEGFGGFATWMKKQSQEELEHAYAMADYVIKRGGTASFGQIDAVPTTWTTPLNVFEAVYAHECKVSRWIDELVTSPPPRTTKQHKIFCGDLCVSKSKKRPPHRALSIASKRWATPPSSTSTSSTAVANKPPTNTTQKAAPCRDRQAPPCLFAHKSTQNTTPYAIFSYLCRRITKQTNL